MRNEYPVTKKRYFSWTWESMRQKPRCVIIIIAALLGGVLIYLGLCDGVQPLMLVGGAVCLYYALLGDFVRAAKRYRMLTKKHGHKDWKRIVEFRERELVVSEGEASATFAYKKLVDIWERPDSILLLFSGKVAIRLYRDCFVDTTWEECRLLMEQAEDEPEEPEEEPEEDYEESEDDYEASEEDYEEAEDADEEDTDESEENT